MQFGIGEMKPGLIWISPTSLPYPHCIQLPATNLSSKALIAKVAVLRSTVDQVFRIWRPLAAVMRLSGASAACLPL
jgi:hypothetical protein